MPRSWPTSILMEAVYTGVWALLKPTAAPDSTTATTLMTHRRLRRTRRISRKEKMYSSSAVLADISDSSSALPIIAVYSGLSPVNCTQLYAIKSPNLPYDSLLQSLHVSLNVIWGKFYKWSKSVKES